MAAALRSSAGLALPRAAAAAAPAPSRLSSAGSNTCRVRAMHHDYSGGSSDKGDGFFAAAAAFGTFLFAELMDGECFGWFNKENTRGTPRMTSSRRRR